MMRLGISIAVVCLSLLCSFPSAALEAIDTITTRQGDKIILSYIVGDDGSRVVFEPTDEPRIIPSEQLRRQCKGELDRLKVVIFDRVGDFGDVKWSGLTPATFMVPANLRYGKTSEGFYILGQSSPIVFDRADSDEVDIDFQLFIAMYEKKQTYKLVAKGVDALPLRIDAASPRTIANATEVSQRQEQVVITSETVDDNADVVNVLSSIDMVRQLLAVADGLPFSQSLQMEMYNLRSLKGKITDSEVIEKINEVMLEYSAKETELKEQQNAEEMAAMEQQQALLEQQKQQEEDRQRQAEEKAQLQEEKQQKRTLWMVVGGAALAVLCFVGNAVFRHFRDLKNQKNLLEMQQSLTRQAEHEASRRSQEVIRNKAHQMANRGKAQLRDKMQNAGKKRDTSNRKTI